MDVFTLRQRIIDDYSTYIRSFIEIRDQRIRDEVRAKLENGLLWPDPLIQLNPAFAWGGSVDELVADNLLHAECRKIFRAGKSETDPTGVPMRLYKHQTDAIRAAKSGDNYVLTTGTGSGKSLSYIIPIVDDVLRTGSGSGIKAVIVYPMNALANSQINELEKFLCHGYNGHPPVTFQRYTGQEGEEARQQIVDNPPDILLTNYVMLELILTRPYEQKLVKAATGLKFLVFDELHTYRGRQGADVAMLIRRLRNTITPSGTPDRLQCIGTSATLAGPGTFEEQQQEVAAIASKLFGSEVMPHRVIVETLRRETNYEGFGTPEFISRLKAHIQSPPSSLQNYDDFISDPLSIWIENTLGLEEKNDRLTRCLPLSIPGDQGAALLLSDQTGIDPETCKAAIQQTLLHGYRIKTPDTGGKPVFAFKLHQFLSKGDTVYATPETEQDRLITLQGQQYAPQKESLTALFPLQFCRECGQEYYSVWRISDPDQGKAWFSARNPGHSMRDDGCAGYLYIRQDAPWPDDNQAVAENLPDDWTEEKDGTLRIFKHRRKYLPEKIHLLPDGSITPNSQDPQCVTAWFVKAPFTFCMHCKVAYAPRLSDFSKLATLGTEGRSTATTVLSMSTVRNLRKESDLPDKARKLLSFTDNRQDASLQAGHFNDFIEVGLVRSALFNCLETAGQEGLSHDLLPLKVFDALGIGYDDKKFPPHLYSIDPQAKYGKATNIKKAFWNVLGYRIYSDLRRGWRIVAPNLEQCGLLNIEYQDMDAISQDDELWHTHPFLAAADPGQRRDITCRLLNFMRRRLAIRVDYLKPEYQERIRRQSSQSLIVPWRIDEDEQLHHAAILFPRSRNKDKEYGGDIFLSSRSAFATFLRRTFQPTQGKITLEETGIIINALLQSLSRAGLVEQVTEDQQGTPGYQIPAASMIWKAGDGTSAQQDELRVQQAQDRTGRTNPFFVDLYRSAVKDSTQLIAREHTAQVPNQERQEREELFRKAELPIMYCSPTMELGVDISQLNAVNMRNVPPTPANYAQRSGRAGRSGQPALVFTYCAQGNSHDQHFFGSPHLMVAGAVSTPRLDLANEDLIRAHVHAIWLSESGMDLKKSLKDLLDVSGTIPALNILPGVQSALEDEPTRDRALISAAKIIRELEPELTGSGWYSSEWLGDVINKIGLKFDDACKRWRSLYRAAVSQRDRQSLVINDASRSQNDRDQARRLRSEAETQIELLLKANSSFQSDFYSYRYFAGEGFLPGYNFPRLPLSAFIPGRRGARGADEYISRARFLAISEFGPGSFIYHEGSRYVISRVMIAVEEDDELASGRIKQCGSCGYIHPVGETSDGDDICEMCGERLPASMENLFRLRNVSTRRRDRISSDEEERTRFGYNIRTGFRFAEHGGQSSFRLAEVRGSDNTLLATLKYGHGATLWRVNMGWASRKQGSSNGFMLDIERGTWTREGVGGAESELDSPGSNRVRRVIPYVEDRKNCLLVIPESPLANNGVHSLVSALKQAIQRIFQLEDFELAAEPMPSGEDPGSILIYEAAEGGAGVLRRLVDDNKVLGRVAREALSLCHFDPDTGENLKHGPNATEECVVACYDCLMNYGNQRVHEKLNRHDIKEYLQNLAQAEVLSSSTAAPRSRHLETLKNSCDSDLEKQWLDFLDNNGLRLPSHGQRYIEQCRTRPDFYYENEELAVYVDGPHHHFPERRSRDREQQDCLESLGVMVVRFEDTDQWMPIIENYPYVFGSKS